MIVLFGENIMLKFLYSIIFQEMWENCKKIININTWKGLFKNILPFLKQHENVVFNGYCNIFSREKIFFS